MLEPKYWVIKDEIVKVKIDEIEYEQSSMGYQ